MINSSSKYCCFQLNETTMEDDDILRDSCAVFGCVVSSKFEQEVDISNILYLGLTALQHRGQESSGMVTYDGKSFHSKKGMGLVSNVYNKGVIHNLPGFYGIGHNRYSTSGCSELINCQPFVVDTIHGEIALAHNGELINAKALRTRLLKHGIGLSTSSDSELITQLMVSEPPDGEPCGPDWPARIKHLMSLAKCSYSLTILTKQGIYAVRDPFGNRPLCLGEMVSDDDISPTLRMVSSESCAFHSINATHLRDVLPGEIVHITRDSFTSVGIVPRDDIEKPPAFCIFEYVYFARADSIFEGQLVYETRKQCGRQLAIDAPVDADIVSTIPESATPSAFGFSQQSGIPYVEVLVKNRYVGRTFIQPNRRLRKLGVTTKFGPLTHNFVGKKIVLLDDSIVRGTTMGPIVQLLKQSGAKEVHIRIASPPIKHPCFMGINIPTKDELVANKMNTEELAKHLNADSLVYLSIEGLKKSVTKSMNVKKDQSVGHCTACLTGEYPVALDW